MIRNVQIQHFLFYFCTFDKHSIHHSTELVRIFHGEMVIAYGYGKMGSNGAAAIVHPIVTIL